MSVDAVRADAAPAPSAQGTTADAVPRAGRRRWLRGDRTDLVVLGIVAANVLYRWLVSRPGYFWQDDYYLMTWAQANPLDLAYLMLPASDHFQPLGLALLWCAQHLFPGSYDAAFAWTTALYALSLWFLYRFLRTTYGWRIQLYLVLVLAGFSVFTLQSYLWYSASVWMAPLVCFSFLAFWMVARYRRSERRRDLALVLLAMTLAVLSHPFAAAVPVMVLALVLWVPGGAVALTGVRAAVRAWRLWPVLALPFLLVPWFYLRGTATITPRDFTPTSAAAFVWRQWVTGIGPGLGGGPWSYDGWLGPEWAIITPYTLFWGVQLAVVVLVVVPLLRRRALPVWLVAGLLVSAELAAVAFGRTYQGGVPLVLRYIAPAIVPLVVAVAATLAVARGDVRGWRGRALPLRRTWWGLGPVGRGIVVVVLVQLYAISFSLSLIQPVQHNPRNTIRAWIEPRIASAQQAGPGTEMIPQYVPNEVIGEWAAPTPPTTQVALGISPGTPRWVTWTSDRLVGFAADGSIVDEFVYGARAKPGPNGACGYAVNGGTRVVPLQTITTYGSSTVNLGTLGQAAHPVTVELLSNGKPVKSIEVVVPAGLKRLYFPLIGVGDALRINPHDRGVFCVTDLVIGERAHRTRDGAIVYDAPSGVAVDFSLDRP